MPARLTEWTPELIPPNICDFNTTSVEAVWPFVSSCLPSWRHLQIHLTPSSWPSGRLLDIVSSSSCAENLETLVISGPIDADDGLWELNPSILRDLIFKGSEILQLRRLVVQQTHLREIKPGLVDQLHAFRLLDVEIVRNPHLTCNGLGVGWLAGATHLRLLNLSRNRLSTVNLAKWGFASGRPSGLLTLDLSSNQISFLKPKSFSRAPNLIKLDLSNNLLTSLPLDVFSGLDNLKVLNLQNNHLTVVGLKVSSLNFATIMPNLRHLQLSDNPLLIRNGTSALWWLSDGCPTHLYQINLDHLMSQYPLLPDVHLDLPPIAWSKCPALSQVFLNGIQFLTCISHRWLDLPSYETSMPEHIEIFPRSFKLCVPEVANRYKDSRSDILSHPSNRIFFPSDSPVSHRIASSDMQTYTRNIDGEFENFVTEDIADSDRVLRVLKLHTVSLEPWLLVFLLSVLFLVVISVTVWAVVCWSRQCCKPRVHRPKIVMLTEQLNAPMNCLTKYAGTVFSDTKLGHTAPVLSSRAAYSPLTRSVVGDDSDYACTSYIPTHTSVRLWNQSDSGMGDVTPAGIHSSFRAGLNTSSNHHSVSALQLIPRADGHSARRYTPSLSSLHTVQCDSAMRESLKFRSCLLNRNRNSNTGSAYEAAVEKMPPSSKPETTVTSHSNNLYDSSAS